MLLVVFGLKAAMLPLYFWLPRTYGYAPAPVAALFAIMTKVGIYAILRVYMLMFSDQAGSLAALEQPWVWWLALPPWPLLAWAYWPRGICACWWLT